MGFNLSRKKRKLKSPDQLRGELSMARMSVRSRFKSISGPGLVKVKPASFKIGRLRI